MPNTNDAQAAFRLLLTPARAAAAAGYATTLKVLARIHAPQRTSPRSCATSASTARTDVASEANMDPVMKPVVTRHAQARMQQRGIARSHVDFLLEFGREYHDHHGAVVVILDHSATQRIARSGAASGVQLDALRGLYAVIGNGSVRTVGHRTRRLRRH